MIHVAFRFDDPSENSDHELEKDIIKLCCKYRVPINFAVIPFKKINGNVTPFSAHKAAHLIDAHRDGSIEISQHGYLHINNQGDQSVPSEFIGASLSQQEHWIKSGKEVIDGLFGKSVRGFVPPFNSFDEKTLQVIKELDFSFLSAGWDLPGISTLPYPIIPRTNQLFNAPETIKAAKKYTQLNPIIVVVLHPYDFTEISNALALLENIFKQLLFDDDLTVTSLNKIAGHYKPDTSINNIHLYNKFRKLHWRLMAFLPDYFLTLKSYRLSNFISALIKYKFQELLNR